MPEQLKPCKCGSNDVRKWTATGLRGTTVAVEAVIKCFYCEFKLEAASVYSMPNLIAQWNNRPIEQALQANIDQLIADHTASNMAYVKRLEDVIGELNQTHLKVDEISDLAQKLADGERKYIKTIDTLQAKNERLISAIQAVKNHPDIEDISGDDYHGMNLAVKIIEQVLEKS